MWFKKKTWKVDLPSKFCFGQNIQERRCLDGEANETNDRSVRWSLGIFQFYWFRYP